MFSVVASGSGTTTGANTNVTTASYATKNGRLYVLIGYVVGGATTLNTWAGTNLASINRNYRSGGVQDPGSAQWGYIDMSYALGNGTTATNTFTVGDASQEGYAYYILESRAPAAVVTGSNGTGSGSAISKALTNAPRGVTLFQAMWAVADGTAGTPGAGWTEIVDTTLADSGAHTWRIYLTDAEPGVQTGSSSTPATDYWVATIFDFALLDEGFGPIPVF